MTRILLLLFISIFYQHGYGFDDRRLVEPISIGGITVEFPEFSLFHLPGTKLAIKASSLIQTGDNADSEQPSTPVSEITVPLTSGWYHFQLFNSATKETLQLHIYSLHPYSSINENGYLNQYRIGFYPNKRLKGLSIYDKPLGFIQVTEDDIDIALSPNFRVGQFLSKQSGNFPKYLLIRPELIIKLERILAALHKAGHPIEGFHVMSGYRTPFYNKAIGNVQYSRHVWGGAADIFIDEKPKDNYMDDLNGDGKINKNDAIWLAEFINRMSHRGEFKNLGGLGIYGSNSAHGPFVHVDVRGNRARW